jgi:FkbM family methyltransferase
MRDIRDFIFAKCLGAMPSRYKRRLFLDLAKSLGVLKVTIKGEYGEISGFIDDSVIFMPYVREGVWSENINAIFVDYFARQTSGTYLDIGANIGLTTIPVARNPHVRCHAFEPEPDNFELLQENVRRNAGDNVELHNIALFSEATSLTLALSPENRGSHRVWNADPKSHSLHSCAQDRTAITVRGDRLDDILDIRSIEMPLAIKIDAEGSEHHIYQGGRNIIRLADVVIMEYWPYGIQELAGSTDEIIKMIEEDFDYAKIIQGDEPFGFRDLTRCSNIVGELKRLADRSLEMEFVDVFLAKRLL